MNETELKKTSKGRLVLVNEGETHIDCACGTEGITVSRCDYSGMIEFGYYGYGIQGGRLTWWNRLRTIWRILTKGTPYNDMVILNKCAVEELQKVLDELTNA
jgi:hypothetical protein